MGNGCRAKPAKIYLLEIIFTFFLVTILSFVLMRLSPIDPAEAYARRNMVQPTREQIETVREEMGLDQPVLIQYGTWLGNAFKLDFGTSLVSRNPVINEFADALPFTLKLVLLSAIIQIVFVIFTGSLTYFLTDKMSGNLLAFLMIAGISIPSFAIAGIYLEIFAVRMNWISVVGNTGFLKFLHPAICLAIPHIAFYGRLLGTCINKEMDEEYIFYARCRGLSERRILLRHGLPHSVIGLIPNFMQNLGLTIMGACFIEKVFSLPGVGYLMIDSILARDAPMIHASVLFLAIVFIAANIMSDLCKGVFRSGGIAGGKRLK